MACKKQIKKFCKSCNCGKEVPKLSTEPDNYLIDEEDNNSYHNGELESCDGFKKYEYVCEECKTSYGFERHWITNNGGQSSTIDGKEAVDYDSYEWEFNEIPYQTQCKECKADYIVKYSKYGESKTRENLCSKCTKKEIKKEKQEQKQLEIESNYKGGFIL